MKFCANCGEREAYKGRADCTVCRSASRKLNPNEVAANKRLNTRRREQYKADPTYRQTIKDRNRRFFYGLTPEQFQEKIDAQGGQCAICGSSESRGHGTWHIDHDHSCCEGKKTCGNCIRGLLCTLCNVTLGGARDSTVILRKMIDYLEDRKWQKATAGIENLLIPLP